MSRRITTRLVGDAEAGRDAAGQAGDLAERRRARLDPVPVKVHTLPHDFVSSEKTSPVSWLNGGDARPLATPPRPFEKGVGKRPTLIGNVETLAHLALFARYGSAHLPVSLLTCV
ncbi:hypothetical protein [Streptomyces sp. 3213.3]|uniref:hypothetical protein n=1 Tax=Streptomyces sp. 3213.3 TaxID=1855348 RepID=UPI001041F296|nr:hypothetical protein [Streptomyces sp. 3213.3]